MGTEDGACILFITANLSVQPCSLPGCAVVPSLIGLQHPGCCTLAKFPGAGGRKRGYLVQCSWPPESCLTYSSPVTKSQGNEPGRSVDPLLYGGGEARHWQKMWGGGQCSLLTFATSAAQTFFMSSVHEKFLELCIF